jgi:hypothetical protein
VVRLAPEAVGIRRDSCSVNGEAVAEDGAAAEIAPSEEAITWEAAATEEAIA